LKDLPVKLNSENTRLILFVQDARTQRVLGVARASFPD